MDGNSKRDVEVFAEALQLPPGERIAFLDWACAGDVEMRRRVMALLKSSDRAGGFLETPPTGAISEERAKIGVGEKAGDQVGRYKLLRQIGEGGCGIVFVAQQEEPVRRLVALKVVKPGMDTESVILRFEAERQALALMDHPNIAHVFDAGATESGRPYFVMELVEGSRITDYCDEHSLTLSARLELFAQVCDAIQHAHQKGIIHRDIKPSNILVATGPEGKPAPKVIDFGIAKATLGLQLTDKTIFTAREMLIGTPAYMSPEQAAFANTEVDTRSDIYSLGILLYELLTGLTPFDAGDLLKAGLDEVRRVIREREPARPSTRLSTMKAADLTAEAQHRQTSPPTLIRAVRGDLDWIAMKAMEKDPARRYATAHGLALDVQRYLADETVSARPPSTAYKFQKLVRRNRLLFGGIAVVTGLFVASLIIVSISLAREKRAHHEADVARLDADEQRKEAEASKQEALTEVARSRQTTAFMNDMLTSIDPAEARGRDGARVFHGMLDKATQRIGAQLTNQPVVQADLRVTLGKVYGNLALYDQEEFLLNAALAVYTNSRDANEKIAGAYSALSELYWRKGDPPQSDREARAGLSFFPQRNALVVVSLETSLGRAVVREGRPAEAESILRRAAALAVQLDGTNSKYVVAAKMFLVDALSDEGQMTNAEAIARDALALCFVDYGTNSVQAADGRTSLVAILVGERKLDEAEGLARQSVVTVRKVFPDAHPELEKTLWWYGRVLAEEGKRAEAADVFREVLAIRRQLYGDGDGRENETVGILMALVAPDGDGDKLEKLAAEIPEVWLLMSDQMAARCRWADARQTASKFLDSQTNNPNGYHLMAPLLAQAGDSAAYEKLCQEITARFAGSTNPRTADRMAKDCLILPRPGADVKPAADLAEIAVTRGGDDPSLAFFQCCKALAELRVGHYEQATNWAQLASRGANPECQAEAAAIMAMAQFKLNQLDVARSALADCNRLIDTKLPKIETGNLGSDWRDWIIAHALQSEARGMIEAVQIDAKK